MSSIERSNILVIVDNGEAYNINTQPVEQYNVQLQPTDVYPITIETNTLNANVITDNNYLVQVSGGDTYPIQLTQPQTTVLTAQTYFRVADFASIATSASYAVTASYVDGFILYSASVYAQIEALQNLSSSLQTDFVSTEQLYSTTSILQSNIDTVSSSLLTFTETYNTGSFTGTFVGDGSGLTGVTVGVAVETASYVEFSNVANKPSLISSSYQAESWSVATSSYALTASYIDGGYY